MVIVDYQSEVGIEDGSYCWVGVPQVQVGQDLGQAVYQACKPSKQDY